MKPTVEKSVRVYSDVSGMQAHSGLSNGCDRLSAQTALDGMQKLLGDVAKPAG